MARIRTIKPEFWEDETIGALSHGARLLFLGSLNLCDDEGLVRWNEMYLGSSLFPYDDIKADTVKKWMAEIVDNELVFVYKSMKVNQVIGLVVSFHKHQRIDKPQPPKLPSPNWRDVRLKRLIAKRDGWLCHICKEPIIASDSIKKNGSKALSIDHVKPQCKGGSDYPSNLKACHISCNHSKSGSYNEDDSENYSENDSENGSTPEGKGIEGNREEGKVLVVASAPKTIEDREIDFMNNCAPYVEEYTKETVRAFFDYWSEKNKSGKKMRWELQQTFEISKRLATWKRKEKNYTGGGAAKISRMQVLKDEGDLAEEVLRKKYANE